MNNRAFLSGLISGMGVITLSNSIRDNRKRAMIRDKGIHYSHKGRRYMGKATRDLSNRLKGATHKTRHRLQGHDEVSDAILEARVRSALGHVCSHPGAIEVRANQGQIILLGHVLQGESDQLIKEVFSVRGVESLLDRLEKHEKAEHIPDLQGEGKGRSLSHSLPPGILLASGLSLLGGLLFLSTLPVFQKKSKGRKASSRLSLPNTDWDRTSDKRDSGLAV